MSLSADVEQVVQEKKYPPHYHSDVDVFTTASGGAGVARAAYRGGARIGYRSLAKRPPKEIPVGFIDWPFNDERHDHMGRTSREDQAR